MVNPNRCHVLQAPSILDIRGKYNLSMGYWIWEVSEADLIHSAGVVWTVWVMLLVLFFRECQGQ
jgi:hypothetical protein